MTQWARDPVPLRELAEEAVREVGPRAEAKGPALTYQPPEEALPEMRSATRVIRLVLVNLLGHAVRFPDSRGLELRAEPRDGGVRLAVADSGPGIPPDEQSHLFEPFRQGEPARSRRQGGIGLGLTLLREMVDVLVGRSRLDSTPGEGTVFVVDQPVEPPEADEA